MMMMMTALLYEFLISSMLATCLVHLVLNLITRVIFAEEYKLRRYSTCNFLHFPVHTAEIRRQLPVLYMFTYQSVLKGNLSPRLTKHHALKTYLMLNRTLRHEDIGQWSYSSTHS